MALTCKYEQHCNIISRNFIMWQSYRPHYASCPRLHRDVWAHNSTQKKKNRNRYTCKCTANFQKRRSKVRVIRRQNTKETRNSLSTPVMITRRQQTRSMLFLGLIYCRHLRRSATGRTAAYHAGTRQHLFLLVNGVFMHK